MVVLRNKEDENGSQDSQSQENVSPTQELPTAFKCKLWHLKKSNVLALGTVYKSDGKQMLHNQALPNDCYKVSIDSSLVDAACIPDVLDENPTHPTRAGLGGPPHPPLEPTAWALPGLESGSVVKVQVATGQENGPVPKYWWVTLEPGGGVYRSLFCRAGTDTGAIMTHHERAKGGRSSRSWVARPNHDYPQANWRDATNVDGRVSCHRLTGWLTLLIGEARYYDGLFDPTPLPYLFKVAFDLLRGSFIAIFWIIRIVTPKVILIAWESFGKIKDALMDKQYQQEDIQELMSKLLEDVRNISEEFLEYINCPSWNRPLFYDNDDDEYTVIWRRPKAITPDLPIEEPDNSLNNSLPEFVDFSDHTNETRSAVPTTHVYYSLPEPPDIENSLIIEPDALVINNVGEINVEDDDSFTFVTWIFLPYLTYPEVSSLLSSTRNEDAIFDPSIFT
ncbi:hypothetical protein Tco_1106461 [Tanacetum coccineum]